MISSEVQRTLVKSPPELWAELSDPAALARHLGELGEIRIVRLHPESSVEWAGENISGSVSIKPSGWGTTVTFSARKDTPGITAEKQQEPPGEAPAAPAPAGSEDDAAAEAETQTHAEAETQTHAEAETQTDAGAETQTHAVTDGPALADGVGDGEGEGEGEGEGDAPAKAKAASGTRPATQAGAQAKIETHAEAEAAVPALPEPASPALPEPEMARPDRGPESRRSFLTRLFGWRRKTALASPRRLSSAPPDGTSAEPAGRERRQADAFAAVREALSEASSVLTHAFEAPAGARSSTVPTHSSPQPPLANEERATDEAEAPGRGQVASPADISAELLAAEEAAAEEVRAVLTAVLDRLGAAHHRPFSRA